MTTAQDNEENIQMKTELENEINKQHTINAHSNDIINTQPMGNGDKVIKTVTLKDDLESKTDYGSQQQGDPALKKPPSHEAASAWSQCGIGCVHCLNDFCNCLAVSCCLMCVLK